MVETEAGVGVTYGWRFLGREVHPLAFGTTIALAGVAIGPFYRGSRDTIFDFSSTPGNFMAAVAVVNALLFTIGWLTERSGENRRLIQWGFLLAAGVFFARATLGLMQVGPSHPACWISIGLTVSCLGAWMLERTPPRGRYE